jgi:DNA helicase HerA-like ATPase
MSVKFKLPNATERAVIFGRTGSGKSVFMVWLLSHASIEERPWIILDYKQDHYLKSIPYAQKLKLGDLPKKAGIYIVNIDYRNDAEETVDDYLFSILKRGNIGVFIDEGSNLPQREPKYRGLKAIFAQGRSKKVPFLFATQRPAWINKSVLSEADYYVSFALATDSDKARVKEFMPEEATGPLAAYHCHWYDIKQDAYFMVRPVNEDETFNRLSERLKPKIRLI